MDTVNQLSYCARGTKSKVQQKRNFLILIGHILLFIVLYYIVLLYKRGFKVSMNNWQVEYWHFDGKTSSIELFFNQLTDEQFKSIAKELRLLELCGNALKLPHSKSLGKGLFELRERKFGYRIYYILDLFRN